MKPLKQFVDFIKEGIVKKQMPDKSRSKSLVMESHDAYAFLMKIIKEVGLDDNNANQIIKNSYDSWN